MPRSTIVFSRSGRQRSRLTTDRSPVGSSGSKQQHRERMVGFNTAKCLNKSSHRPFAGPVAAAKLVPRNGPESGEKRNKGKKTLGNPLALNEAQREARFATQHRRRLERHMWLVGPRDTVAIPIPGRKRMNHGAGRTIIVDQFLLPIAARRQDLSSGQDSKGSMRFCPREEKPSSVQRRAATSSIY